MLQSGQIAPGFGLLDHNGDIFHLSEYKGDFNVVIYFYPKDDTPGCTIEAQDFTRLKQQFADLDTMILGISKDNAESHCAFVEKYNLGITLLSDTDGKVCEQYGVWQEKEKDGVKRMGIVRSTFVIGMDGKIRHALYNVQAKGHAEEILQLVKQLG